MDILTKKRYEQYDYRSRYTGVPYFYNTEDDKDIYGLGSNLKKNTSYYTHKINPEDTLDKLALKYYNNPTYWWVIAFFNDIQDAFVNLYENYQTIKVPAIASISFGDER